MSRSRPIPPPRRPGSVPGVRSLLLSLVALLALGGAGWSIWWSTGDEIRTAVAQIRQEQNLPKPPTPEEVTRARKARENRPIGRRRAGVLVRGRPVPRRSGPGPSGRRVSPGGLDRLPRHRVAPGADDAGTGPPGAHPGDPRGDRRRGPRPSRGRPRRTGHARRHPAPRLLDPSPISRGGPDDPLGARINLVEGAGPARRVVLNRFFDVVPHKVPNHGKLVLEVERMIPDDFRAALDAWKLPPSQSPKIPADPDALPGGVEAMLGSLSEFDQFAALRALHDDVRRRGGSPTRWQALARGYAMPRLADRTFGHGRPRRLQGQGGSLRPEGRDSREQHPPRPPRPGGRRVTEAG